MFIERPDTSDVCQESFGVVVDGSRLVKGSELTEGVAPSRGGKALVDAPSEICPIHHRLVLCEAYVPLLRATCQMVRSIPDLLCFWSLLASEELLIAVDLR